MHHKERATKRVSQCDLKAEIKCQEEIMEQQRLAVKELANKVESRGTLCDTLWTRLNDEAEEIQALEL